MYPQKIRILPGSKYSPAGINACWIILGHRRAYSYSMSSDCCSESFSSSSTLAQTNTRVSEGTMTEFRNFCTRSSIDDNRKQILKICRKANFVFASFQKKKKTTTEIKNHIYRLFENQILYQNTLTPAPPSTAPLRRFALWVLFQSFGSRLLPFPKIRLAKETEHDLLFGGSYYSITNCYQSKISQSCFREPGVLNSHL